MLTVTKKAAALLKAAKAAEGGTHGAGVRIRRGTWRKMAAVPGEPAISVGFAIRDEPAPDDEEFKQHGLRIFVENALVEPLDGHTLDVREAAEGMELVFV